MPAFDQPLTLPAALGRAARSFGGRTAYIEYGAAGRRSLTWADLHREATGIAAGLVALGLKRGDRLAICAENNIDWVIACHATALAGGVAVFVYFDLKPREIEAQVSRPGCRFLIASGSVLAKLGEGLRGIEKVIVAGPEPGGAGAISFAQLAAMATESSREVLAGRAPAPDDLEAIIYTSGTTGGAKGVMLSHRNFLSNGAAAAEALDVGPGDSVLLVLPLHHALSFVACVVLPVLIDATIVIENDLRRIRDRLQEVRPTIFFGVPALYELVYRNILARAEAEGRLQTLLDWQKRLRLIKRLTGLNLGHIVFRSVHKALGGNLRFLVSGGAALKPSTALDYFSLGLPLLQGWGMTEAAPAIAVQRFSRQRFRYSRYYEDHAGSVGTPIPDVEVRLIDVPEKDIRVVVNGEGEVIARGPNIFQGYWQAEDATREAKLDGWLRTGDLARIDRDGSIYLTGRSKYIIVLDSGEKVHPDEIEDKLRDGALIEDVCVLARTEREKTVVTAVIYPNVEAAKSQGVTDEANLRRLVGAEVERLGRELAAYKRVARIELSDAPLPKTALLKIARGQIAGAYVFDYTRWAGTANAT